MQQQQQYGINIRTSEWASERTNEQTSVCVRIYVVCLLQKHSANKREKEKRKKHLQIHNGTNNDIAWKAKDSNFREHHTQTHTQSSHEWIDWNIQLQCCCDSIQCMYNTHNFLFYCSSTDNWNIARHTLCMLARSHFHSHSHSFDLLLFTLLIHYHAASFVFVAFSIYNCTVCCFLLCFHHIIAISGHASPTSMQHNIICGARSSKYIYDGYYNTDTVVCILSKHATAYVSQRRGRQRQRKIREWEWEWDWLTRLLDSGFVLVLILYVHRYVDS